MSETIHATAIEWGGKAILFKGRPGSGKSTRALELIEQGGRLIADDLVELWYEGEEIWVKFPQKSPHCLMGCIWIPSSRLLCVPFCPHPLPVRKIIELTDMGRNAGKRKK